MHLRSRPRNVCFDLGSVTLFRFGIKVGDERIALEWHWLLSDPSPERRGSPHIVVRNCPHPTTSLFVERIRLLYLHDG